MRLRGDVESLSLADLIQVNAANRRSCRVRLRGDGLTGELIIDQGEVVDARLGDLDGEEAVYAALAERQLQFEVKPLAHRTRRTILLPWTQLVLESFRRQDEGVLRRPTPLAIEALTPTPLLPRRRTWMAGPALVGAAALAWLVGTWLPRATEEPAPQIATTLATQAPPGPSAPVEAADLVAAGGTAPRLLAGAPPSHPDPDMAIDPTVLVRLRVDERGQVAEPRIHDSRSELVAFEPAALAAVERYRFTPGRWADGRPAAAWINWPVTFSRGAAGNRQARVVVKGSDTIGGALGPALATAFEQAHPGTQITWEGLGSSTAFLGLFDGSADVGASSRPIDAAELAEAQRLGVNLVEHVFAYDGVAVVVHPRNPVASLSSDDLARIFAGSLPHWRALGGNDVPVMAIARPAYSGTAAFFAGRILGDDAKGMQVASVAPAVRVVERTEDLVRAVAANPGAIGYLGLGWARAGLRTVPLRAADGRLVAPSPASVRDGSYPLHRSLYLYTRARPRSLVAKLVRFALSSAGAAIVAGHGFVPGDVAAAPVAEAAPGAGPGPGASVETLRITFPPSSASLEGPARSMLLKLADRIYEERRRVVLVGHSDTLGDADTNQRLAAQRARRVANFLRHYEVPSSLIAIEAARIDQPLATNSTPEGRTQNRRVDVFLLADD